MAAKRVCRGSVKNTIDFNDPEWEDKYDQFALQCEQNFMFVAHIPFAEDYDYKDLLNGTMWPPKGNSDDLQIRKHFGNFMRHEFDDKYSIAIIAKDIQQRPYAHPPEFTLTFYVLNKADDALLRLKQDAKYKMKGYKYPVSFNCIEIQKERERKRTEALYKTLKKQGKIQPAVLANNNQSLQSKPSTSQNPSQDPSQNAKSSVLPTPETSPPQTSQSSVTKENIS